MIHAPILAFADDDAPLHGVLLEGLRGFNESLFPNHPPGEDLAIAIRNPGSDEPVGGLCGRTAGG